MLPPSLRSALPRARALPSLPSAVQQRSQSNTTPSPQETASTKAATEAIKEHSEHLKDALTRKEGEREVTMAEVVSGAPPELQYRSVRIFQPSRNTMQSAASGSSQWRIDWDVLPSGGRWENRLMGWASSADYMQATRLLFRTKEEAVRFAEKQGWDYFVQKEHPKRIPPKAYAENFVHIPGKLRIARTK